MALKSQAGEVCINSPHGRGQSVTSAGNVTWGACEGRSRPLNGVAVAGFADFPDAVDQHGCSRPSFAHWAALVPKHQGVVDERTSGIQKVTPSTDSCGADGGGKVAGSRVNNRREFSPFCTASSLVAAGYGALGDRLAGLQVTGCPAGGSQSRRWCASFLWWPVGRVRWVLTHKESVCHLEGHEITSVATTLQKVAWVTFHPPAV